MDLLSQDPFGTLQAGLGDLQQVVASLDDDELGMASNCEPWTVRRLASHALHNQLFWAGVATGSELVSIEVTMGATPIEGDLKPVADSIVERTLDLWQADGVLTSVHATPAGDLPGSVVILFATIDAFAHAWDLSASVGRSHDFPREVLPTIAAIIDATAEGALALGLIQPPTDPPHDATQSEALMALIGRRIPRSP